MKSNSLVKYALIVLTLFCVFQFASLIPTSRIEAKAEKEALELVAKLSTEVQLSTEAEYAMYKIYYQDYISKAADEVLFSIPYVKDYTYRSLKDRQLKLGLDLKGGMQFTLSMNSEDFLTQLMNSERDSLFAAAILKTNEENALSHPEYIEAFFDHYQKIEKAETIIERCMHNAQLDVAKNEIETVDQLKRYVHQRSKTIAEDLRYLLNERINSTGLTQGQISVDLDLNNIHVEIPGAWNPERMRELLTKPASLEFWNVYRVSDPGILEGLVAADELYR